MVVLGESRCVKSGYPIADTDLLAFPDEPTTRVSGELQPGTDTYSIMLPTHRRLLCSSFVKGSP
jgi:hypothetical protein